MGGFETPRKSAGGSGSRVDELTGAAMGVPGKRSLVESLPPMMQAQESPAGGDTESAQLAGDDAGAAQEVAVQATIPGGGQSAETSEGAAPAAAHGASELGEDVTAHNVVAPGGSPSLEGGANECIPNTSASTLAWDVIDTGTSWRPNVTSLTLAGRIRINPWPSNPSSMTVPNTPNPVDGGNISNTPGPNHWQTAIDDLSNYNGSGGGAGPYWHDTAASRAHEWAHWNQDYVGDAVMSAAGGNWPAVNARIDALNVPKADHADAAAARAALSPLVHREFVLWRVATFRRWSTLISAMDKPGQGGRGYAAGAAVLAGHIARIRAYKTAKGW